MFSQDNKHNKEEIKLAEIPQGKIGRWIAGQGEFKGLCTTKVDSDFVVLFIGKVNNKHAATLIYFDSNMTVAMCEKEYKKFDSVSEIRLYASCEHYVVSTLQQIRFFRDKFETCQYFRNELDDYRVRLFWKENTLEVDSITKLDRQRFNIGKQVNADLKNAYYVANMTYQKLIDQILTFPLIKGHTEIEFLEIDHQVVIFNYGEFKESSADDMSYVTELSGLLLKISSAENKNSTITSKRLIKFICPECKFHRMHQSALEVTAALLLKYIDLTQKVVAMKNRSDDNNLPLVRMLL